MALPIKNQSFTLFVSAESTATPGTLYSWDDGSLPAVSRSIDGAAWTITGLTVSAAPSSPGTLLKIVLDAASMNGEAISVWVQDGAAGNFTDVVVVLNTREETNLVVSDIADAVWDEVLSGHQTGGTAGQALQDLPSSAEITDDVWNEAALDHQVGGTMGEKVQQSNIDTADNLAIADFVWTEPLAEHSGDAGSTAEALGNLPTAAEVADDVWTETLADHSGNAGSTAEALLNASTGGDVGVIAAAVWDEPMLGFHDAGNSAGKLQQDAAAGGDPVGMAAAIWDATSANFNDPGTMGELLNAAGGAFSPSDVADAVWQELLADHSDVVGSAAEALFQLTTIDPNTYDTWSWTTLTQNDGSVTGDPANMQEDDGLTATMDSDPTGLGVLDMQFSFSLPTGINWQGFVMRMQNVGTDDAVFQYPDGTALFTIPALTGMQLYSIELPSGLAGIVTCTLYSAGNDCHLVTDAILVYGEAQSVFPTPGEIAAEVDTVLTSEHGDGQWDLTAGEVDTELTGSHGGGAWNVSTTNITDAIAAEFGPGPYRLLASDVDDELSASHGAGLWTGGGSELDIEQLVNAVWDEQTNEHLLPGSTGQALLQQAGGPSTQGRSFFGTRYNMVEGSILSGDFSDTWSEGTYWSILPGGSGNINLEIWTDYNEVDLDMLMIGAKIQMVADVGQPLNLEAWNTVNEEWDVLQIFPANDAEYELVHVGDLADYLDTVNEEIKVRLYTPTPMIVESGAIKIDWVASAGVYTTTIDSAKLADDLWSTQLPGPHQPGEAGRILHDLYITCSSLDLSGVTVSVVEEGARIEVTTGITNLVILEDLVYPNVYDGLILTAKSDIGLPDSMADLQLAYFPEDASKSGLIIVNGAAADKDEGYITPDPENGKMHVFLSSQAAAELREIEGLVWDLKAVLSPSNAILLASNGDMDVTGTSTNRVE